MNNKKIERMAYNYLRGKKLGTSDIEREAKKYANRIKKYREISGKKAVPSDVKEALHYTAPNGLIKSKSIDYFKNLEEYEKKYGKPSLDDLRALNYVSAKKWAKIKKIQTSNAGKADPAKSGTDESVTEKYDKIFSVPKLGKVSWYSLPMTFRASRNWPHTSGSFMYNNADVFWVGELVDLDSLAQTGVDGFDHTVSDFFGLIVSKMMPDIVFISGSEEIWYTTRQEWEQKVETAPGFLINRRYR